jgi:hypothetical protein
MSRTVSGGVLAGALAVMSKRSISSQLGPPATFSGAGRREGAAAHMPEGLGLADVDFRCIERRARVGCPLPDHRILSAHRRRIQRTDNDGGNQGHRPAHAKSNP